MFETIGRGAFATVHRGEWLHMPVAIKVFTPDEHNEEGRLSASRIQAFLKSECKVMSNLRHPNVLLFMGVVAADPLQPLCMVSEYFQGGSLSEWLQRNPFDEQHSLQIALKCARGLLYLHSRGVLHRDLKSENVLVDAVGRLRLADFGLATIMPRRCYTMNVVTLPYRAPELLVDGETGLYTVGVDWWSVGCVLYEVAHGAVLFDGVETIDELRDRMARFQQPAVSDPDVRKCLCHLLQTDPMARIPPGCSQPY